MRYGFVLPGGDAAVAADLAAEAEQAGWDGFFCCEPTWGNDAWVMLTAAAMRTSTIRLGTMLTPLPKRKPWEVASQVLTLDNLSGGRVILSVGLGVADEPRFWMFEDDPGRKVRAEMLDEGLEMIELMCRGEPFEYAGRHYHAHRPEMMIPPPSTQQPRVTTWVVGLWPAPAVDAPRGPVGRVAAELGRGRWPGPAAAGAADRGGRLDRAGAGRAGARAWRATTWWSRAPRTPGEEGGRPRSGRGRTPARPGGSRRPGAWRATSWSSAAPVCAPAHPAARHRRAARAGHRRGR